MHTNAFLIIFLFAPFSHALCGYESCPKVKEGYLNVHLVQHSHDDVGWLKTVDQYYYGDRNSIQLGSIQYTLDSVVEQLLKDPSRRFIYVEISFFWRWWTNQDDEMKTTVKNLVEEGRLEFVNGGWVMNDEATTYYNEIIDQYTLGLRFLNDTFGHCALPRVAWSIDPFGHSREFASILAGMNFDGLFFGRLDYQDKSNREAIKNFETIWIGSPNNLEGKSKLFTGVLYNGYDPPKGYCFDVFCSDDPINDDPKLYDYNLDSKVNNFVQIARQWGSAYRSNHVLMTMGSDFQYMAAHTWFKNLDKLIKHVNALQDFNGTKVNLIYSTPSCYLQEVHKAGLKFSTKTDDFFPYASDPHAFWNGYFTSRPNFKYNIRFTNNYLQFFKSLSFLTGKYGEDSCSFQLSEAVGISQHHDASTGTAKQHVSDDYNKRLFKAMDKCEEEFNNDKLALFSNEGKNMGRIKFCLQLNISSCSASESSDDFVLFVHNSLPELHNSIIRIPVTTPFWKIVDHQGNEIKYQTVPIPKQVQKIPGRNSPAEYEILFASGEVPPHGLKEFRLTKSYQQTETVLKNIRPWRKSDNTDSKSDFKIENARGLSIVFNGQNGLIKKIGKGKEEIDFKQNLYYYKGMSGDNRIFANRASGAYIFRPNGTQPELLSSTTTYSVYQGDHCIEVHQVYSNWASQVIRLYDHSDSIEFEWLVGPIPIEDGIGKEIVSRYSTNIKTDGIFFTDSNGRELLKRKRDFRPTWQYKVYEPVAGNYYPVNSRMIISENEDLIQNGKSVILLNDRTQGGTSMRDGEIEIMLHRRLLFDDAFGVGEALNETAFGEGLVTRGKHWIVLAGGESDVPISIHRPLAHQIYRDKIYLFEDAMGENSVERPLRKIKTKLTTLMEDVLPKNVNLLSFERVSPKSVLFRLEHFYEVGEDPELSNPVKISLAEINRVFQLSSIQETTLGGNIWKNEAKRFDWDTEDGSYSLKDDDDETINDLNEGYIQLSPMQIRTFIMNFD